MTFFLPFFAVSCGEMEISLSGFEMSFGKTAGNFQQDGTPLALILIVPTIVLAVLTFFMAKNKPTFFIKNIFIIVPIFNIFAGIILRFAAKKMLEKRIADYLGELNIESFGILKEAVTMRVRYGFILYILFNVLLLLLSSVIYFLNVRKDRQ